MAFSLSRSQYALIDSQGHMNQKFYKISKSVHPVIFMKLST